MCSTHGPDIRKQTDFLRHAVTPLQNGVGPYTEVIDEHHRMPSRCRNSRNTPGTRDVLENQDRWLGA